jgi:hypothetical protein
MLIPVLRYASGTSKRMYTSDEDDDNLYCGTFYYFDIDSDFLLYSRKILVGVNKVNAWYLLSGKIARYVDNLASEYAEDYAKANYQKLPFD